MTHSGGIFFSGEGKPLNLINNSKVISNTAINNAGGIYVRDGILNMESGQVSYNIASEGGGIYLHYHEAVLNLNGGEISYNQSTETFFLNYPGGGVHVNAGIAYLNGGQIVNNSSYRGGGIVAQSGQVFQNGTDISNNTATYGGGVYVAFENAVFTQTSGKIQENHSTAVDYGGGGFYIFLGTVNLLGGEVISNVANYNGGGIYLKSGHLNIDGSIIKNNQASNRGGGIFNSTGIMTITNSTVQNNQANLGGGIATSEQVGYFSFSNISSSAILSNSTIAGNGGGISNKGILTLTNVTLSENHANGGGGLYNESSGVTNLIPYF